MDKLSEKDYPLVRQDSNKKKIILPGYPTYPDKEDIYEQGKEEKEIDPEQITLHKENEDVVGNNQKDFDEDQSGDDLDIPGSELDDPQEVIGSEDEENNYYSLGDEDSENPNEDSAK